MPYTRDPKAGGWSFLAPGQTRADDTHPSRLAHWPPRYRSAEHKPKQLKYHPGEQPKAQERSGWRLTRGKFSDSADD